MDDGYLGRGSSHVTEPLFISLLLELFPGTVSGRGRRDDVAVSDD